MLCPIVRLEAKGSPRLRWYATSRSGPMLTAFKHGVFTHYAPLLESAEDVAEYVRCVQDAWDAVRAIRHGTSLERFPRDLTTVSQATGEAQ